ncbi:MAG: xanthine dehydrogenase family protein molybdopterin-binding subunit [Acidobacteria bacterium]|nr:xanthine dehydrogenase family protein molybdopterin-binding subunit [Acidobacteriota bacterium]
MQDASTPTQHPQSLPTRYDARQKVMGKATYAAEFNPPETLYAWMIQSTIPKGTILSVDTSAAEHASGVVKVLTCFNAPKLPKPKIQPPATRFVSLLQTPEVHYNGEPIGLVIAKTLAEAQYASSLVTFKYQAEKPQLDFEHHLAEARMPKRANTPPKEDHGEKEEAWKRAVTVFEQTYSTPFQTHNPLEPHATVAFWVGEKLTVYNSTQYVSGDKQTLAKTFALPLENVHVICPYVGGGFGCKGSSWSHVPLAAMAAKVVGKPVKLVLDRQQMFGPVGYRPRTVQKIKLGVDGDGKFVAIKHDVIMSTARVEDFVEPSAKQTDMLYACKNISTSHKMVDMDIGVGTFQRAPGEASGTPALESALDELAYKLKMDPLELRLRNYAEIDPGKQKRFTAKHLREAYQQAAERFGWSKLNPEPGSMRDGNKLIGWGMATATYPANRSAAGAVLRLMPDGKIMVGSGTQDIGTGTYTVMAQTVVEELGVDVSRVDAKLGDTDLPKAPVSGGSQSTASVGPAVKAACAQLKLKLATLVVDDAASPHHGAQTGDLEIKDGFLVSTKSSAHEPIAEIAKRHGEIEVKGEAEPNEDVKKGMSAHSWGAVFAEVEVDESSGMVKVRRVVATYDIGRLINKTTGTNQLQGGIVWGIGFALHEESALDKVYGRISNENLAEYHVPVNRDVPEIDVTVLDIPDTKFTPQGGRGIGEIGITGVAGAIANAVFHATGKRIRHFPITPDKVLMTPKESAEA